MDIDELNRRLFEMTPSERRHRAGEVTTSWQSWLDRYRKGDDARIELDLAPIEQMIRDAPADQGEIVPGLLMAAGGSVLVRKNSRFNPMPEHTHSYIEMCYVYAGTCPQRINGADVVLQEDEVVLLDTRCPHAIAALGAGDIMLSFMMLDGDFLRREVLDALGGANLVSRFLTNAFSDEADHNRYVRFSSRGNRRVKLFFQELLCEAYDPSSNAAFITRELFRLIFAELISVYEDDLARHERDQGRVPVVPIVHYIEENFRTCTQEGVAQRFSISPKYVSMLLKKHTGMTYRQLVQALKLGRAASLLRTTPLSVVDAAHEAGYENATFFYRKFKERYGCLPGEYRARYHQHR